MRNDAIGLIYLTRDGKIVLDLYDEDNDELPEINMTWPLLEMTEETRQMVLDFLVGEIYPKVQDRAIDDLAMPTHYWKLNDCFDDWLEGFAFIARGWAVDFCRKNVQEAKHVLFLLDQEEKKIEKAIEYLEKARKVIKKISIMECLQELNCNQIINLHKQYAIKKAMLDLGLNKDDETPGGNFNPKFSIFAIKHGKNADWEHKWLAKRDFRNIYEYGEKMMGIMNIPADDIKLALVMMHELLNHGKDKRIKPVEIGTISWNWWGEPERSEVEKILRTLLDSYGMPNNWLVWRAGRSDNRTKLSYCLVRIDPVLAQSYGQWHVPKGIFLDERNRRSKPDTNSLACREWTVRVLNEMFRW